MSFTKDKFTALPSKLRHKHAAKILKGVHEGTHSLQEYLQLATWLGYPPIDQAVRALDDRYHEHLRAACIELREYDFLLPKTDRLTNEPFLPIDIYLESLRSAHNVGSILRTTEAFRLGTLHFAGHTPIPTGDKVKKSAMGTEASVPTIFESGIDCLRKPIIALEITKEAMDLYTYQFPTSFSLMLGNEALGLSDNALKQADYTLKIPLTGGKNSLNVAAAFAIVAYEIRRQRTCSSGPPNEAMHNSATPLQLNG